MLLPEFDMEMANTRKVLERVPDAKFGWKPHEKSGSMGWMAGHIANLPGWGTTIVTTDELNIEPPFTMPQPNTSAELLALFDKNVKEARAAIAKADFHEQQQQLVQENARIRSVRRRPHAILGNRRRSLET